MKIKYLLLAAITIATGCTSINPNTGQREYDPVKSETVKAALKPVVSGSVTTILLNNPHKKETYGTYFRAIGNVFCNMKHSGTFTPSFLIREVERITLPMQESAPPLILVAKQSLIGLYEVFYAQRLRAELPEDKWPAHVADLFCEAIHTGLVDAGLAGVDTH